MNYLEIIDDKEDKNIIQQIEQMLEKMDTAMTPIQINNFVLNDVEYPTLYGKYKQAQFELYSRFNQLIDLYYRIKGTEIKMKKVERKIKEVEDDLEKEFLELKKEKLEVKMMFLKRQVKKVLKETRVFYEVYNRCKEFHNLSEEEALKLEVEAWVAKAVNMPLIFEERYGESFMKKVLGEEGYEKYLDVRRKVVGLLPRELLKVEKIEYNKNSIEGRVEKIEYNKNSVEDRYDYKVKKRN